MPDHDDLRESRERKLKELTALGLPYFPKRFGPNRKSEEIREAYETLQGSRIRTAGRLMRVRTMGKAAFAHIQDSAGQIQLYFKLDVIGEEKFNYFKLLDLGDIIGIHGTVFKTRTEEVSIEVDDCVLLAKAYLPLPEKFHGLTDVETRYRQRYLDLISNDETRRIFQIRSRVISSMRQWLDGRGFMEVETPVLQPLYGGAAANPFATNYRELDTDVYLRIATELYLKRLIVGGLERVYEIGKDFRNEGFSRKNSPEFTMLELYQAYADYGDIMRLVEEMISTVAQHVLRTQKVVSDEHEINLQPPWMRLSIRDAVQEYGGINIDEFPTAEGLAAEAKKHEVPIEADAGRGKIVDELVSHLVEPNLIQPTFLCDFPVDFPGSLLAKRKDDNPNLTDRFETYIGGMELGNAFTEENDPMDQAARMEEATKLRGEEHHELDRDFVTALEHGMPPTGGLGIGIDRLVMILTNASHIRETILFPLLRPT